MEKDCGHRRTSLDEDIPTRDEGGIKGHEDGGLEKHKKRFMLDVCFCGLVLLETKLVVWRKDFNNTFFPVKKESIQEIPATAPFKEGLAGHVFMTIFYKCPFCRVSKRIEFLHTF